MSLVKRLTTTVHLHCFLNLKFVRESVHITFVETVHSINVVCVKTVVYCNSHKQYSNTLGFSQMHKGSHRNGMEINR